MSWIYKQLGGNNNKNNNCTDKMSGVKMVGCLDKGDELSIDWLKIFSKLLIDDTLNTNKKHEKLNI